MTVSILDIICGLKKKVIIKVKVTWTIGMNGNKIHHQMVTLKCYVSVCALTIVWIYVSKRFRLLQKHRCTNYKRQCSTVYNVS